ncbi:MAG: LapA family protein [Pseudomonadota bacterium]
MLRAVFYAFLIFVTVLIGVTFTTLNPGSINLDLAFLQTESRVSTAFAVTFVLGFVFGIGVLSLSVLRLMNQRRKLKKSLRLAEAEVNNLRSIPLRDAE